MASMFYVSSALSSVLLLTHPESSSIVLHIVYILFTVIWCQQMNDIAIMKDE